MVRIAVVGGGFGGVHAIRHLQRSCKDAEIILFEPRERFVFTPLLHEVAAGVLHVPAVTHEYGRIFRKNVCHIRCTITGIDLVRKRLLAGKKEYAFDYVLLAHGSQTRIPPKVSALGLKSVEDALAIRHAIERNVLDAAIGNRKDGLLRCVIAGGGPTGVELAAELAGLYRRRAAAENVDPGKIEILLLHSGPNILPHADPRVRRAAQRQLVRQGVVIMTNTRVISARNGHVIAEAMGRRQEHVARCVIWVAGVEPVPIASGVRLPDGHFPVERTLQVAGTACAFAVGDASALQAAPLADLAQVATQQGRHAARNLIRIIDGKKPLPFRYSDNGFILSVGQRYAAGKIRGIFMKGVLAWFVWRTTYLVKFVGVRSKLRMALDYTRGLFT